MSAPKKDLPRVAFAVSLFDDQILEGVRLRDVTFLLTPVLVAGEIEDLGRFVADLIATPYEVHLEEGSAVWDRLQEKHNVSIDKSIVAVREAKMAANVNDPVVNLTRGLKALAALSDAMRGEVAQAIKDIPDGVSNAELERLAAGILEGGSVSEGLL